MHAGRYKRWAVAAAVALAAQMPAGVLAKDKGVITMTEQVPNFSLVEEKGAKGSAGGAVLRVVKRGAPVVGGIAVVVWIIAKVVGRARQKQLRDFQAQLKSFSSMLDLDLESAGEGGREGSAKSVVDTAKMAKAILERSSKKYKFRENEDTVETGDDVAAKVQLDLFRSAGESAVGAEARRGAAAASQKRVDITDIVAESPFEIAIADALGRVEVGDTAAAKAAVADLAAAREAEGMDEAQAKAAFNNYVSRVVSVQIDRAAVHLDSDDRESLKNLHELAITMSAAQAIARDDDERKPSGLSYVGAHAGEERTREELYRRYAVFCLSSEERVKDDLQSLVDMQTLLSVSDARAETINTEIAKGMFQVAVSAAMADGSLDEGSRDTLDKLKDSFGDFLDGGSADNIMSEVAVMRAMYSLQQLLQEQGVSEEDVKELRKMCKELGVDIDDMLQNADALGDALGPEAKDFVESLRALLSDSADGSVLTTSAATIEQSDAQSSNPPDASQGSSS